jgi:acyl carrier protein
MDMQPDVRAVEQWLINRLAALAKRGEHDIDVTLPFSHYELDSLLTVQLTADLEDWLGRALPPTLFWDYPTTRAVALHLAQERPTI